MEEVIEREQNRIKFNTDFRTPAPQLEKIDLQKYNIKYIVLAVNNAGFNMGRPSYETKLFGKTLVEWVKSACDANPLVLTVEDDHDPIKTIKPFLDSSEWTVVLYSDTPLITNATISKSFNYCVSKHLNVCKLPRGYIFKTEYVKRIEEVYALESVTVSKTDFVQATDLMSLSNIAEMLKNRIYDFHLKNGVYIMDKNSTYIESDVSISSGTIIYPNNSICGSTEIGENVILYAGNRILGSIVATDATLENSSIVNSVIGEKCKIKNSSIGNDCLIKANCKILDYSTIKESVVDEECKIMGATIKGSFINKNCKIYDGVRIIGKNGNIILQNNVSIGENSVIARSCEIEEAKKIKPNTILVEGAE